MRLDHDELSCPTPVAAVAAATSDPGQEPRNQQLSLDAKELSRKIAASGIQNDAFLLANEDQLMANFSAWTRKFPNLRPCYDVAFNACPWLLEALDSQPNVRFSCQCKAEIQYLLERGISAKKLIYSGASPKLASHIKFANSSNVPLMTFGSPSDLKKLSAASCSSSSLLLSLQNPSGLPEVDRQWLDLLNSAKDSGFNVQGVSFQGHVEPSKMLALAKMAVTIGRSMGHEMKIIDIGSFQESSTTDLQKLINGLDSFADSVLCHLGSEFIENVFNVGAKVIGKAKRSLIINDGIFGTFQRLMVDESYELSDISVLKKSISKVDNFDIYGSSGDDMDILVQDYPLDCDVDVDDWLFFPKMGAFSYGLTSQMISVKLPGKFGNFRLFSPDTVPSDDDANLISGAVTDELNNNNMMADLLEHGQALEVIFLDIQGQDNTEQQTCLDLFEELPSLASYQDSAFWDDFYADLR